MLKPLTYTSSPIFCFTSFLPHTRAHTQKRKGSERKGEMGMLSFISTVPSLAALIPSPSKSAAVYLPYQPARANCKLGADSGGEEHSTTRRRVLLHTFGATVATDLIGRSNSLIEVANAADLIQRRQRSEFQSKIKGTLATALKEHPDLVPSVLTLALNDAMTYDKATKSGGPNGSIRFSSEISRPENKNLAGALSLLEEIKKEIDSYSKGGPISYSDLIQFAAQSAVKSTFIASAIRKCGGNEEKGTLLYTAYGSTGQWGLFDRQFGRSDAEEPDPEGRVPQWDSSSVSDLKEKFKAVGLGPRQLAVMSAFLGQDQSATEALLASDAEVKPWVEKYQRSRETVSQTDYEVDLITALTKLSSLGQQINYEAYSYPVERIDFKKLKL